MKGFIADIEDRTEENRDFRRVIYTGPYIQLVLMSLEPDEELGEEIHENTDQFFRFGTGIGEWLGDGHVANTRTCSTFRHGEHARTYPHDRGGDRRLPP